MYIYLESVSNSLFFESVFKVFLFVPIRYILVRDFPTILKETF